ncbi:hypothetical protein [Mucilaginibacter sp. dw_454]|uniref:hypothetical protein n=1 Tax=Mucilaginibacter sp. dw_454 TaxID=2720079 RepID=UPI001BD40BDE|nr:hypothetical protein [Mucilaginibacter sp. dw_454]
MITIIKNLEDVKLFTRQLVSEGTNFHPDDDFNNYVNLETGEPSYTLEEAEIRNQLLYQCFKVCEDSGEDIYDLAQEIFLIETGLDKFIPLPSQDYNEE